MPAIRFDVPLMFASCGGFGMPQDMRNLLLGVDKQAPSLHTIQMWRMRQAIPAGWLASVLYALDQRGFEARTFFANGNGNANGGRPSRLP